MAAGIPPVGRTESLAARPRSGKGGLLMARILDCGCYLPDGGLSRVWCPSCLADGQSAPQEELEAAGDIMDRATAQNAVAELRKALTDVQKILTRGGSWARANVLCTRAHGCLDIIEERLP